MEAKNKNQDHYHSDDAVNQKKEVGNREELDSKVNTSFPENSDGESLTNDESADTDPNQVKDKPSFK